MKRRRRTLLLLALLPLSIGASAIGYWRYTSETSAVADDDSLAPHLVARRNYVFDGAASNISSASRSQNDHAGAGTADSLTESEQPQSTAEQTEFEPSFSDIDGELFATNFSASDFGAGAGPGAGATGYGHAREARGGNGGGGSHGGAGGGADGAGATGGSKHASNDQGIKNDDVDSLQPSQDHRGDESQHDNPYVEQPIDPTVPGEDGSCSPPWCGDPQDPYGPLDEHWPQDSGTSPETKPHVAVPEPGSLGLLGMGLLGLLATRRRAARR